MSKSDRTQIIVYHGIEMGCLKGFSFAFHLEKGANEEMNRSFHWWITLPNGVNPSFKQKEILLVLFIAQAVVVESGVDSKIEHVLTKFKDYWKVSAKN